MIATLDDPLIWPCAALPATEMTAPYLVEATFSGGRSLSGVERRRLSGVETWRMERSFAITTPAQIQLWRVIEARLSGRAGVIRMDICDAGRSPAARPTWRFPGADAPHGDGARFSDGARYRGQLYPATAAAAAPARARRVRLQTLAALAPPEPGHHFSVGGRLHRIASVAALGSGLVEVDIVPGLRVPMPAGARVEFDRPQGLWRLSADSMPLALRSGRFSSPTLSFEEALT
jgi:hypothetical protein